MPQPTFKKKQMPNPAMGTGNIPAGAQSYGGGVTTAAPKKTAGLGLHLGLAPGGRAAFRKNPTQFLAKHPKFAAKYGERASDPNFAGAIQGLGDPTGALSPAPAPGIMGDAPVPGTQTATPNQPFNYEDLLAQVFGQDNPFAMRGNYSDPNNPIYGAAKQNLDRSLASTRARFAGMGMGNSSRAALAEGDANADFGAQIAQLGETAYQNDANRLFSALGGANEYGLQRNDRLMKAGTDLTGVGASEQVPPLLGALFQLLGLYNRQTGVGTDATSGSTF